MAEAYKGLTIRIGGDATGLQKALRSADSAIRTTQSQLRKMTQALRLDPGNAEASARNLQLVGQRAVEASGRLNQLKRALREVSGQKVDLLGGAQTAKTVRELADETEDAASRAAQARESYAQLTHELAALYTPIQNAVRGMGEFERQWEALHDGRKFKLSDMIDEEGLDPALAKMRELGVITDEQEESIRRVRQLWADAYDENEVAKAVSAMRDLEVEIDRSGAEVQSLAREFSELSRQSAAGGFGEGIDDRLRAIDAAAEDAEDSLRRASRALAMDPSSVGAAEQKVRAMADSMRLAESRAELLRQKISRMDDAGIGEAARGTKDVARAAHEAAAAYDEASAAVIECRGRIRELSDAQAKLASRDMAGTGEYRELEVQIREAREELARLESAQESASRSLETSRQVQEYRDLEVQLAETAAQAEKLGRELEETQHRARPATGALTSFGMSLSTTVTPALAAMGYYAVQSAGDIDSAYRDMRKTVDATERQFESLREAAVEFSTTNVTSADQILSIQAIGGELGVATEDLRTFAETVSNLDVATNINAEDAATALGQLDNILKDLDGSTMPNFADALVRLGNNGASTESQITDIAARIGSMASIIGMSTPEILAWSSTIASTGQGAEAAGTAISKTMSDIESAVARGGDDLQAFAEVAGMSADEFARAWSEKPSDAMKAFIEGLNRIEGDGGSAVTTLQDLGITATRQTQAIQGLMQMIGGLGDNLQMSEDAWNGVSDEWGDAGDAAREAERKAEGFSGSIAILKNTAQALAAEFGESLTPAINFLSGVLKDAYDAFEAMPDSMKGFVVAAGALTAALGPGILMVRSFVDLKRDISSAATAFRALSKGADAAGEAIGGAGGLIPGLGGLKAGLAALGVAAVAVGVTALAAEFAKAQEEARLLERATDGLAAASRVAGSDIAEAGMSTEGFGRSVADLGDDVDATRQRLADLADEFDEMNAATSGQINQLNSARSAISRYNGESDLTAEQLGSLKGAVELLNRELGTSYEVASDGNGAYWVMADGAKAAEDSIYSLIDAQIKQVQIQAQLDKLADAYEVQAEAADKYTEALEKQREAQERYNAAQAEYDEFLNGRSISELHGEEAQEASRLATEADNAADALAAANTAAEDGAVNLDAADEAVRATTDSLENMGEAASGAAEGFDGLVKGSQVLNNLFDGDEDMMSGFADALEETGISLDAFGDMSSTELADIANEWIRSGDDITEIMERLGITAGDTAEDVRAALEEMSGGEIASALEESGVNLDEFAQAMAEAGISAGDLSRIGSENFAALAANCGGSIDTLIWMLQNYNAQPLYNKDGTINVNDVPLVDALGNTYTYNETGLVDKNGNIVIQTQQITDANGLIYSWNEQGQLVDPHGTVVVDTTQITLANGAIATYNNGQLVEQDGTVHVGFDTLTDCLGNMAEFNGTELVPIEGDVYCDYSELSAALGAISDLRRQDGYTATVHINTVRTTTTRTVNAGTVQSSGGAGPRSAPAALQALAASRSAMASRAAATALASAPSQADAAVESAMRAVSRAGGASAFAAGAYETAVRSTVSERRERGGESKRGGSRAGDAGTYIESVEINQKVVTADEDIYVAAPQMARQAAKFVRMAGR